MGDCSLYPPLLITEPSIGESRDSNTIRFLFNPSICVNPLSNGGTVLGVPRSCRRLGGSRRGRARDLAVNLCSLLRRGRCTALTANVPEEDQWWCGRRSSGMSPVDDPEQEGIKLLRRTSMQVQRLSTKKPAATSGGNTFSDMGNDSTATVGQ